MLCGVKTVREAMLCSSIGASVLIVALQDAKARVAALGKPDLFVTMTCNPDWPEIERFVAWTDCC